MYMNQSDLDKLNVWAEDINIGNEEYIELANILGISYTDKFINKPESEWENTCKAYGRAFYETSQILDKNEQWVFFLKGRDCLGAKVEDILKWQKNRTTT